MVEIICKNLSKTYNNKHSALSNLNVSINSNGIFALIGRNGAGKTTLIRILSTELMPTKGTAKIDDLDVIKQARQVRELIAVTPQEARPVPWMTPKQSIMTYLLWRGFGYSEAKKKAMETLKLFGIEKEADRLNMKLSGGLRRKVAVATIVASDAKILFLDEPTTGLDPISRRDVWKILSEFKKDHFIFLTTHYLEEAEALADNIGLLDGGKLLALGTLAKLRRSMGKSYSITVFDKEAAYMQLKYLGNKITVGKDGNVQLLVSEKVASKAAIKLVRAGVKFSINPVSLDDIFYYLVKKPITGEGYEEEYTK
jgi:ABC-2 type transport system ATP-binding protein